MARTIDAFRIFHARQAPLLRDACGVYMPGKPDTSDTDRETPTRRLVGRCIDVGGKHQKRVRRNDATRSCHIGVWEGRGGR